jgi:predicted O-methyltransferase YrrM
MSAAAQALAVDRNSDEKSKILAEIYRNDGYFIADILDAEGLAALRGIVDDKFHSALKIKYPDLYDEFAELNASQYHLKSDLIDHANMWRKAMRTFDADLVERFLALPWKDRMAEKIGPFEILGAEEVGLPDIYMRLVRPNAESDVGPIHADQWFTDLGNHSYDPDLLLVKVWIPVYSEPQKDGLIGVPGSHLNPVPYDSELRDGYVKPVLPKEVEASINPIRLPAQPGQAVSFRYDFLHGGTVNRGTNTRVSLEATLVLKRAGIKAQVAPGKAEQVARKLPARTRLAADWNGTTADFLKAARQSGNAGLKRLIADRNLELPAVEGDLADHFDGSKAALFNAIVPAGRDLRILMLGSDYGIMAAAACKRLSEKSRFTIVESERKVADMTVRNIGRQNLDKIVSVVQGEYKALAPFLAKSGPYDVVVLDAKSLAHAPELLAWLSDTGLMLLDGVLEDSRVLQQPSSQAAPARAVLDAITGRNDVWATVLPVGAGLLLVTRS